MDTNINKNEWTILAGKMSIENGKVKPDPAKGQIRIYKNRDGLMMWEWKSLESNDSHEIVIFEGEWEWIKVSTNKGRVYKLQNKVFEDDLLFYWMQNPNTEIDEENNKLIDRVTNKGIIFETENKNQEEPVPENVGPTVDPRTLGNKDFIKHFAEAFGKIEKVKYPQVSSILSRTNIRNVLSDEDIQKLLEFLPEGQQDKSNFEENISSPQFYQALDSLTHVLQSENILSVIQSFGLDPKYAQTFPNGIEAFIKALVQKYQPNK